MEKLVYFMYKPEGMAIESLRELLLERSVQVLRDQGASGITLNVADLTAEIETAAPGRLMGPWQEVSAVVSFWLDSIDQRSACEAHLADLAQTITGYLVTESIPQSFEADWEGGRRRPGVTQFGANGKPPGVSDEEFYHNWQVLHSAQSFELHPLRWSYVRNAVARPLTQSAPAYRAIVSEHFRTLEDFTDDTRYFGSPEAVAEMIEAVPGFCDMELMFSLGMSEYFFR